jgi:hypothetical protein
MRFDPEFLIEEQVDRIRFERRSGVGRRARRRRWSKDHRPFLFGALSMEVRDVPIYFTAGTAVPMRSAA